ncbi:MAG: M23 family metallopeptidase [Vulcanococcus sp.]
MPVALLLPALQLLQPMAGVITQGVRPGHPAIDIACATGTPVHAAHDGVARVERSYTHGITVVLNGSGGLTTSYSHLQSAAGSGTIRQGDLIGLCGNTGIWSSGPHLHFESNRPELLSNLLQQIPAEPLPQTIGAIGGAPPAGLTTP